MSAPHRVVRVTVGVFMAVVCALGMGGFSAASAAPAHHHPPRQHCPRGHHGHYPPGQCRIFFNRGQYHPGQKVKFQSGQVFKGGEKVTRNLYCNYTKYHKRYKPIKARSGGRAVGQFRLSTKLKNWGCTLSLKGKKSGVVLNGHIKVRK